MKKLVFFCFYFHAVAVSYAQEVPPIHCKGLPGCNESSGVAVGTAANVAESYIRSFIDILVELVAVIAVFALIFGGIMYIISGGNDEKTGKAKKIILWALAGVVLAALSWSIIALLNNISINI